jgi:hypothetical protein
MTAEVKAEVEVLFFWSPAVCSSILAEENFDISADFRLLAPAKL